MDVTRRNEFGGMTTTAATNQHALRHNAAIRAVLFDLSGTLLDERYLHHGLEHLAAALHERWDIDPTTTRTRFMTAFRAVSQEYAGQRFDLMRDAITWPFTPADSDRSHGCTARDQQALIRHEDRTWTDAPKEQNASPDPN
jgi:hypothetical protein